MPNPDPHQAPGLAQPCGVLLEYARDLISVVDVDGAFRYTGPSHQRVLGYAPDVLRDTSVFTLLHPDDRERAAAL